MDAAASSSAGAAASAVSALSNSTWTVLPSAKDLFMALPRAASRAAGLVVDSYEMVESLFGGEIRENAVAAATRRAGLVGDAEDLAAMAGGDGAAAGGAMSYLRAFNMQQLRTFGGIFNYMTSKWGLCCFFVAIVLNRTSVYAATRRHLRLRWQVRLFLRSLPILLLLVQIRSVLQGIRCQTSPEFAMMRYGVQDKLTNIDFSQDGGFMYAMSSRLLMDQDDLGSCRAVRMIPDPLDENVRPDGSLTLLWPAFKTLCFSKFIEVLSSTVQGLPSTTETGMSLFEHSLAYAETESMVGALIGIGPLSSPTSNTTNDIVSAVLGSNVTETMAYMSRNYVLSKFNTSPEVLLITLISLCNSLSSHALGIFGKQSQFRLLSTGVWGVCFLGCFVWAFNTFSIEKMLDSGIFRFPTVCVVGFFPHLLIVAGIVLCATIYLFALVLSVISPPPGTAPPSTWYDRLRPMYENMQANMQLASVRVNMREDFYTALLRLGLSTLTAASEAVFLNEGRHINLGPVTWLEEERLANISRQRGGRNQRGGAFVADAADDVASGVQFSDTSTGGLVRSGNWQSGYSRERTTKILKTGGTLRSSNDGVGTLQRHSRYSLAFNFGAKILRLIAGWHLLTVNRVLQGLGIRYRPAWMRRMLEGPKMQGARKPAGDSDPSNVLDFWILSDKGVLSLPKDRDIDVEAEVRKRMNLSRPGQDKSLIDRELDNRLYNWFTNNGWWGERDSSGDFVPPSRDDDLTSVVSTATDLTSSDAWESDHDDDDNDDGRRTPTQRDVGRHSREQTPVADEPDLFHAADIARLLDPQDLEARNEARILARHLASDGIVTRSRFRGSRGLAMTERGNRSSIDPDARLLLSSRYARPPGFKTADQDGRLSAQEEAEVLEFLILKARKEKGATAQGVRAGGNAGTESSPDDMFNGGPQCVVCQTSPRTIMAWPCRCLSLCEDCRISLAMNNFGNCVCCRQEVVGFSRLFVP